MGAQVWIKNSFHETSSKWYILSAYKTDFVKGKFKPSQDSLFKDGKKYEKNDGEWGNMDSRSSNLTISRTGNPSWKNHPRWNIINDPDYKINGSICVRRLFPRKVITSVSM